MPVRLKAPAHLPKTWKYGNRQLKPGLGDASREEYKQRIVGPVREPVWSRAIGFINVSFCTSNLSSNNFG